MNEMEKAQRVIDFVTDHKISSHQLANELNISHNMVLQYFSGKAKLKNVKWPIIHQLALLYDKFQINESIKKEDFFLFFNTIADSFDPLMSQIKKEKRQNKQMLLQAINEIKYKFLHDPNFVIELYKAYENK